MLVNTHIRYNRTQARTIHRSYVRKFHWNRCFSGCGRACIGKPKTPCDLHQNSTKSLRMASKWNKKKYISAAQTYRAMTSTVVVRSCSPTDCSIIWDDAVNINKQTNKKKYPPQLVVARIIIFSFESNLNWRNTQSTEYLCTELLKTVDLVNMYNCITT